MWSRKRARIKRSTKLKLKKSGSGKTTLLNAITFKTSKNLKVSGEIMLNGSIANSQNMSIVSCFVQQADLFFGTMTG